MAAQRELMLNDMQASHRARMQRFLVEQITAAGGWLSFERYMDLALYAPTLGYYSAGAHKLGAGGDFTTAPEVSSLFGACVARQCAEILRALGAGSILEIGAGSGRLAVDILTRLDALGAPPDAYWILEVSADACAGSISRPRTHSTASFWPTKCWMPCRSRVFVGVPPVSRNSESYWRTMSSRGTGSRGLDFPGRVGQRASRWRILAAA